MLGQIYTVTHNYVGSLEFLESFYRNHLLNVKRSTSNVFVCGFVYLLKYLRGVSERYLKQVQKSNSYKNSNTLNMCLIVLINAIKNTYYISNSSLIAITVFTRFLIITKNCLT